MTLLISIHFLVIIVFELSIQTLALLQKLRNRDKKKTFLQSCVGSCINSSSIFGLDERKDRGKERVKRMEDRGRDDC